MKKNLLKVALVSIVLISNLSARNWITCSKQVCDNMGISSSSPYDCWDKLADKYAGGSSGNSIVYPICDVAISLNKSKGHSTYGLNTVGNCSAAIAKNMGIYLSRGSVGESMCKIADKVKKTKSLR